MENKEVKKEKLSYEELENVCHQLSEQSRNLYGKLQEANMSNLFRRLDYLFAVIQNSDKFPSEFTSRCTQEVMAIMTIQDEKVTPEGTEESK